MQALDITSFGIIAISLDVDIVKGFCFYAL